MLTYIHQVMFERENKTKDGFYVREKIKLIIFTVLHKAEYMQSVTVKKNVQYSKFSCFTLLKYGVKGF